MGLELETPERVAHALLRAQLRRSLEHEERALWDAVVLAMVNIAEASDPDALAEVAARLADAVVAKRRERYADTDPKTAPQ